MSRHEAAVVAVSLDDLAEGDGSALTEAEPIDEVQEEAETEVETEEESEAETEAETREERETEPERETKEASEAETERRHTSSAHPSRRSWHGWSCSNRLE